MKRQVLAVACIAVAVVHGSTRAKDAVMAYGIADADHRLDHTNLGTLESVGAGGKSGTRWGIEGTEDLGGGTKALFVFEQGFDLSDNSVAQGNVTPTTPNSAVSSTGGRLFSRTSNDASNAGLLTTINIQPGFDPWSLRFGIRQKF